MGWGVRERVVAPSDEADGVVRSDLLHAAVFATFDRSVNVLALVPSPRCSSRTRIGGEGVVLALLLTVAAPMSAQHAVIVSVAPRDVHRGTADRCSVTRVALVEDGEGRAEDSVHILVRTRADDPNDTTGADAPLLVRLDDHVVREVPANQDSVGFSVGERGLNGRELSLSHSESRPGVLLCNFDPVPTPRSSGRPLRAGGKRTAFIANGEVSNALRSGSENGVITGLLGIRHVSRSGATRARAPLGWMIPDGWDTPGKWYRWVNPAFYLDRLSYPVGREELRFLVNAAPTQTPSLDSTRFAEAILAPATTAKGGFSYVHGEYMPLMTYGIAQRQAMGLRAAFTAARSDWKILEDADGQGPATATEVERPVVLFAFDAGVRWIPLSQDDDKNNSFNFNVDVGYSYRSVRGDGGDDEAFMDGAIGRRRATFQGPMWAAGLSLRDVTAFANFTYLGGQFLGLGPHRPRHERIRGIEGWQTVIGFRFEAPFFEL